MDDQYIEAVAGLLAAAAAGAPRVCENCGGHDIIVAAMPLDPTIGAPCLPVSYCRSCDADAPETAGMFAAFDEARAHRPDRLD